MNVELLEMFPQQVDEPRPGASRRSDPPTSKAAGTNATCAVKWGSQRFRLLDAYAKHGSMTDEQAGHRTRIGRVADTRRCSELRGAGLIIATGELRLTSTGAKAMVCQITNVGRRALEAAPKP